MAAKLPGLGGDYKAYCAGRGKADLSFAQPAEAADSKQRHRRHCRCKPFYRLRLARFPFTSFSEHEQLPDGKKPPVWFALDETRPLAFFAGIWTRWTSVRKVKEGETTNDLFGFLTTEPNMEASAIHPKAMPVILRTQGELDQWMTAPTVEALKLQRPLPNGALMIIARGEKQDPPGLLI